jgi:cell division protein YceG involved in septum cleavage
VVNNATLFELRATIGGKRGDLKPGTYYLREDMSYGDVLDRLTEGPGTQIVNVTIPEGLSRREIAPLFVATTRSQALRRGGRAREPRGVPVPGDV